MPYKDPERQRQAQHAHYLRNKERYIESQRRRRAQPGYRDREFEARRDATAGARPERPARPPRPPAPAPRPRPARKLTPEEQAEARRIEEYAAVQRRLKDDAMRRLGVASHRGQSVTLSSSGPGRREDVRPPTAHRRTRVEATDA